jgi:hypothetical protein
MTTYAEVAGALVSAGYLSDADVDAAVAVLTDALIVEAAEEAEAAATEDYAEQEDLIAEAEVWEREDAASGDLYATEDDARIIAAAADQMAVDKETVIEAEAVIAAAYTDAAAALLAAQLIDEANQEAVAGAIADVWVVEDN